MRFVVIILLFVFLIGGLVLIYFLFEYQQQDMEIKTIPFIIYAEEKDKLVETGYVVKKDGVIWNVGKTDDVGGVISHIPTNSSLIFFNKNINNQTYYTFTKEDNSFVDRPHKIILKLYKPSNLTFYTNSHLGIDNPFNFTVRAIDGDLFKNLSFCIRWSLHIISIFTNYEQTQPPNRLKGKVDRCYTTNLNLLNGEELNISLNYISFGVVDSRDFINITFIDKDYINNEWVYEYNNENVGSKDINFYINNIY